MNEKTDVSIPAFPPQAVARNVGEFAHDVIELAELQMELLRADAQDSLQKLKLPGLALLAAISLGLGSVPVVLLAVGYGLVAVGLVNDYWISFLLSSIVGVLLSLLLAHFGWNKLLLSTKTFNRSVDEFGRNIRWLKKAINNNKRTKKQSLNC